MHAHRKGSRWSSCESLPLPFSSIRLLKRKTLTQITYCSRPSSSLHSKSFRESRLFFRLVFDLRSAVLLFRVLLHGRSFGGGTSVDVFGLSRDVVGKLVVVLDVLGVGLASFGHAAGEDFLAFGGVLAGWRGGGALGGGGWGVGPR